MLQTVWQEFYQNAVAKQDPYFALYNPNNVLAYEDGKISLKVNAHTSVDQLRDRTPEIVQFISQKTQTAPIEIAVEIRQVDLQSSSPYTDKEKLDFMMEKQPKLKEFIESLGLQLDLGR